MFGIHCAFTDSILRGLESVHRSPVAVVYPGPPGSVGLQPLHRPQRSLPMASDFNLIEKNQSTVPTFTIGRLNHQATIEGLIALAPDILVVACFPHRIPEPIRAVASTAALNIHPSLLPRHRGPDPLFWTLRAGNGVAGVTIHQLTHEFDAGPIAAQSAISYPDGMSERHLEAALAQAAADLMLDLLPAIERDSWTLRPQDVALASYETWPTHDDYIIDTRRTARSAFNFIRGIAERDVPVTIKTRDGLVVVSEALVVLASADQAAWPDASTVVIPFEKDELVVRPQGFNESRTCPQRSV